MSERPSLFGELCAGSAAVSLRLVGGQHANPPIGYMGGKRGYARAILGVLGLRQGLGAHEVWLNDAGPWGPVWRVLTTPGKAEEVAAIIRSWQDEEPRALWERLKAEGWGELTEAGEAAAWTVCAGWAWTQGDPSSWFGHSTNSDRVKQECKVSPETLASRVEAVARWLVCNHWSTAWAGVHKGYNGPSPEKRGSWGESRDACIERPVIARRVVDCVWPTPVQAFHGPAQDVPIPEDCDGVFCYIDPPYVGCTGYAADMPREDVIATAFRWSDAGAVVCISEAVPIEIPGWWHVEITSERKGQKRTFSRQKREWLTLNREPAWRPSVQRYLFPVPEDQHAG